MKKLYLVWYEEEMLNKIGLLTYDDNIYKFKYINYEFNDLQLFSKNGLFYGFEDINKTYVSSDLFPTIINRLPSKKRPDYNFIMDKYKISSNDNDFEILEKTKGELSGDKFLFVNEEELDLLEKLVSKK